MAVIKYISVREVISKIYRDLNLEREDRWVDMVEWIAEALQKIGAHPQYVEKTECIQVENYRATIPCDLHRIQQVAYGNTALRELTGSFDNRDHHNQENKANNSTVSQYGYTINEQFFNLNFREGEINVSYIGLPVDTEGFPLIPDDVAFTEAIEKYIVMRLKYPEFLAGTFNPNIYQKLETDWHKYCAQARGSANMPSIDEWESIKNQWMRLLPKMDEHSKFFKRMGNNQRIAGDNLN